MSGWNQPFQGCGKKSHRNPRVVPTLGWKIESFQDSQTQFFDPLAKSLLMNSDSKTNSNTNDEHIDPLMDSLLHQYAKTSGTDDEDFLAEVESAIDESEKVVPISDRSRWRKSLAWASTLAAVIMLLGVFVLNIMPGKQMKLSREVRPQIVATPVLHEDIAKVERLRIRRAVRPSGEILLEPLNETSSAPTKVSPSSVIDTSGSVATAENSDSLALTTQNGSDRYYAMTGHGGTRSNKAVDASRIPIEGNENTFDRVIRRELPLEPGSPLDTRAIASTSSNVRAYTGVRNGPMPSGHKGHGQVVSIRGGLRSGVQNRNLGESIVTRSGLSIADLQNEMVELDKRIRDTSLSQARRKVDIERLESLAAIVASKTKQQPTSNFQSHLLGKEPLQENITGLDAAPNPVGSSTQPSYAPLEDNTWASPLKQPLSTFSIDVDTASWTNVRGMIRSGLSAEQIPNDAVRIEELINYFDWEYPQPKGEHPFAFATESAVCPWNPDNLLLRIGVQGREIAKDKRAAANLVFLLDVSGSMNQPEKLPLVKKAISTLVEELNEQGSRHHGRLRRSRGARIVSDSRERADGNPESPSQTGGGRID